MSSRLYKRRLEDVQRHLNQARESLNVLQEQVMVWNDALEDSRIRALVSETPLQAHEYDELSRHVGVANAEMNRRAEEVRELVEARDELLRDWTPEDDRG
jgi:ribosomal protein L16 Arg81 hydroxylase